MHYFYYFINNGAYYGGITDDIADREYQHNYDLKHQLKCDYKPWHLIQGKIALTILWVFNTKKEAVVYEKQWIIANYKNDNCLNCSVSNSEYDYPDHRDLSAQGGGFKAKPFFIKEYPSSKILLEAESTYDKKAQEFLKMSPRRLSLQLNDKRLLLFIRLSSEQIVYLEYLNQSLSERAELLGRSIEPDYSKAKDFKQTLSLKHKNGHTAFLENYKTYSDAAKMLGLTTESQRSGFCKMVAGKIPSAYGWSLVKAKPEVNPA